MMSKDLKKFLFYGFVFVAIMGMMTAVFVNQGKIRKMLGIKKAAKPVSEEKMQGYRTRLRKFYEKHKPEDIDKVDETLEKWAGNL